MWLNSLSSGGGVSQGPAAPAASEKGVVYKRTNPKSQEEYIGQSKSPKRYQDRQGEHNRAQQAQHKYELLGRAKPGKDLDVLEESMIRANGGLKKEGGSLVNKRHQMIDPRYRAGGGKIDDPNQ